MHNKTYTTGEVAHICGVSSDTVSRWFDQGQIEGFRLGDSGDRRIPHDKLCTFMIAQGIPLERLSDGIPRILVIDDDTYYLDIILDAFSAEKDILLYTASTAFEAGALLIEHNPHLIILDLNHSELSASLLKERAKARTETSDTPILGLTALSEEGQVSPHTQYCDHLLAKPFTASELRTQVNRLLHHER